MKPKKYTFKDKSQNEYSFRNYEEFADWWFSIPRRRIAEHLEPETFDRLNRVACGDKEARIAE